MIKKLISKKEINAGVSKAALEIEKDFEGEDIIMICVLRGSVYFFSDLSRKIKKSNVKIDFMRISSYGGKESSGKIKCLLDVSENLEGKNVLIVEDIIDTGISMEYLIKHIGDMKPKKLKTCVLLDKPSRRKCNVEADYSCFKIDDKFIVGYGLDYDEEYRNLDYIGYIE